jgi:hypothetical protein
MKLHHARFLFTERQRPIGETPQYTQGFNFPKVVVRQKVMRNQPRQT